tara:strand:- start:2784 stop:2954 length:171 start_codon:yes stop_codon:yes gene_type:complete
MKRLIKNKKTYYNMKKESNIIYFLRYRRLGIAEIYFRNKIVVLCRPKCEMPHCCEY